MVQIKCALKSLLSLINTCRPNKETSLREVFKYLLKLKLSDNLLFH